MAAPPAATDADLRAYLSLPTTQKHLRNVVAGALKSEATRDLVGELSARAQVASASSAADASWTEGRALEEEHAIAGEEGLPPFS